MTSAPALPADMPRRPAGTRILAWPRELWLNPVLSIIHNGLEQDFGWRVGAFSYWHALFRHYKILHYSFPSEVFRNRSSAITLVRFGLALGTLRIAKLLKRRVVWTIHNLADHEGYHPTLERMFMDRFTAQVDHTVHLSEAGRDAAIKRYPALAAKPAVVIPHPRYTELVDNDMTREAALAALGLPTNCQLILAFGVIRRYKNLLKLIRAFHDLPNNDARLVVAGYPQDEQLATTLRKVATDDRVSLMFRAIDDREVATLLKAASLVVAPYVEILNSGAAFMCLTHGRPILVPDRGAMKELQHQVGPLWIKLFAAPLTPLVLADALHWAAAPRDGKPDMTPFSPDRVTTAYDAVFKSLT